MLAERTSRVLRSLPSPAAHRRRLFNQLAAVRSHSGALEPSQCSKLWAGKGGASASSLQALLRLSAVIGPGLAAVNLGLQKYAEEHPQSLMARAIEGDNRLFCHYVVPIFSAAAGLGLWLAAVVTAGPSWGAWYFGALRQRAVTGLLALSAGHYGQELFANEGCGLALQLHHVIAVGVALGVEAASCWRGLLVSWGALYEAGSLLLCLGYVGVLPRGAGHWAATLSSVGGMAMGVHGLLRPGGLRRLNAAAWFNVTILLALGLGRIREGASNLSFRKGLGA